MTRFFAFFLMCAAGAAQAIDLSPERCQAKDPDGLAYIALGSTVLKLPIRHLNVTSAPASSAPPLMAPDPNEPVGCRNNPLRQQSLMINFGFDAWLKARDKPSGALLKEMTLIASSTDYWGIPLDERHATRCKLYPRTRTLTNGLVGCLPALAPRHPDRDEVGSYRARPEVYKAPFDKPFVVACRPSIPKGTECHVSYKILPTVNITYVFVTSRLALDDVIEFDKRFREDVQRAVVPEYKWN
ncbi:hypothetical protein [Pseudomonas sp. NPDC089406]|uniref:hypothetical protein n=1 Tax=Pseudomonas sp. NPDC089406 TaxID=3364463 RepID=UPI00384CE2B0